MGCGYSTVFELEWKAHFKAYTALKLSKGDVHKLWEVFRDIDTGNAENSRISCDASAE